MNDLTLDKVKQALPVRLRTVVTQDLVDKLNALDNEDIETAQSIRDNFVTYISVISEGKFKLTDYLSAIKYVTYKVMGKTNREAYQCTFPDRWERMVQNQTPLKDMDSIVTAYNRNKLVNKIYEQTLIPSWILNQDAYQEAINTQVRLMRTAKSERVQSMAADSILSHLARPDAVAKSQLSININTGSVLDDLQNSLIKLAESQQQMIRNGVTVKEIAEQRIIDVEPE